MVQVQQRVLACLSLGALLWAADTIPQFPNVAGATKFYPDDPVREAPLPRPVTNKLRVRSLSDLYELFALSLTQMGERQPTKAGVAKIPAAGGNTLGEVPDRLDWYTNRHDLRRPLSLEQLARGPNDTGPPATDGPWAVLAMKSQGTTPGFLIRDSAGRRFHLKFDPPSNPEMATAADAIGSRFFHALGYYVPENYLVTFSRNQLTVDSRATVVEFTGRKRKMNTGDVDETLRKIAAGAGRYRATAALLPRGEPVGPFRYYGTRLDDPNDIFPHEHRRELRGLFVLCAWLGHDDSSSANTFDTLVEERGRKFIRHELIDFGSILGSASTKPNPARAGHDYLFGWKPAAKELFSFGFYVPGWAKTRFPDFPSVGRLESAHFDPERYLPEVPNPAFQNALPEDLYWGAKKVLAFTNEDIRAIVKAGQYSDLGAEAWVIECLIARRDKIAQAFLNQVLAVDHFDPSGDELHFEDLAVRFGVASPRAYSSRWFRYDNVANSREPIQAVGFRFPSIADGYYGVEIGAAGTRALTTVYFRHHAEGRQVVGIDRSTAEAR